MLFFRRRPMREKSIEHNTNNKKDKATYEENEGAIHEPVKSGLSVKGIPYENNCSSTLNQSFGMNVSKYIGQTVTIFVAGGGPSGSGFTGVILEANNCFVRLLIRIGSAPTCTLRSTCMWSIYPHNGRYLYYYRPRYFNNVSYNSSAVNNRHTIKLGALADIPIDKIASFVHNNV